MPQAASRLALLIQLLDITGYDLAISLDIDPSLISKWKRKRRKIPGRTDAMPKIAGYLLDVDARQGGRTIVPLLNTMSQGSPMNREKAIELLTQWLLDPEPPEWYAGDQKDLSGRLEKDSYSCRVDVFRGVVGRRIAVLRLLDDIRELPPDHTLFIYTQEDLDWIIDDPEFLSEFRRRLSAWACTGHKLEVIHWVDRRQEHLQALIQHLLPLHIDSRINSWYYPLYGDLNLPLTCLIVPGVKALVGSNMDADGVQHTIVYSDQPTVRQLESIFQSVKVGCVKLIDYFQTEQIPILMKCFLDSRLRADNQIISIQSRLPLLFCLPSDSLNRILSENGISGTALTDIVQQWSIIGSIFGNKISMEKRAISRIRIMHHLGAIEQVLKQQVFEDPFLSAFTGQPIQVGRCYFVEYLRFLANALLRSECLEIALIRSDTYSRSAWPNQMILSNGFWAAWGMKSSQNRLIAQESTLVHAFGKYFQDRWQMVPHISRERQSVARCLRDLADFWDEPK
jgi:transcriptional regulator with XRE-family HTH domain